jgi:spoIIIJ-associated protein
MEWIEKTGVSVEAAKEAAIDVLGVAMDEAEFEVVETETVGLFGRVKSPARVRARVLPKAPPPREERRNRRSRNPNESRGRKGSGGSGRGGDGSRSSDDSSGGRSRQRSSQGAAKQEPAKEATSSAPEAATEAVTVSLDELAAEGTRFIGGLVETVGLAATVHPAIDDDRLSFSIKGKGLGVLVGRGGRTADAIQELTRAVLLKSSQGSDVRISVDVDGYRELRRSALVDFGTGLATRAVAEGVSIAVDPMGSVDRKILHDAVQSVEGAESASEGMGSDRRVVIRPRS